MDHLRIGEFVGVVFGTGWGRQVARVLGPIRPDGRILVVKWRMSGRCWTKPTLVLVSQCEPPNPDSARWIKLLKQAQRAGAFAATSEVA